MERINWTLIGAVAFWLVGLPLLAWPMKVALEPWYPIEMHGPPLPPLEHVEPEPPLEVVDPNTASAYDLADVLHGVGTKTADRIIETREKAEGIAYREPADLAEINGISMRMVREWDEAGELAFGGAPSGSSQAPGP